MACGKLSTRFYGNVLLFRHRMTSLTVSDLFGAACISPDLRESIQNVLGNQVHSIPKWIHQTVQENYHDHSVLEKFATIMSVNPIGTADKLDPTNISNLDDFDQDKPLEGTPIKSVVAKSPLCLEC